MTVKELKDWLEELDEKSIVLFRPDDSRYVYDIDRVRPKEISSFWGADFTALVFTGGQVGGV